MAVYFVQAGEGGPIKIGVACNVEKRIGKMRVDNAAKLTLLGVIDGGRAEEKSLHNRFGDAWIRGEWFRPEPLLVDWINANTSPYRYPRTRRAMPAHDAAAELSIKVHESGTAIEAAARLGITRASLHNVITGRTRPNRRTAEKIADIFGIDPIRWYEFNDEDAA